MAIWPNSRTNPSQCAPTASRRRSKPFCGWLRLLTAFGRNRRGAALVEFGFISPVLILFLLGIMEFGYFMWNRHSVEFAVEETGRLVMTKESVTDESVTTDFKSRLLGIDPDSVTATVSRETIGVTTFVVLTANYTYSFLFAGYLGLGPVGITSVTRVPLRQTD